MQIENVSKRLSDIPLPSSVLYSTLVVDASDCLSIDLSRFQKVIVVSNGGQTHELPGFHFQFCIGQDSLFVSLYERPDISNDISFVIQGPCHRHTPFTVLYTAPYGSICLGLWESELEEVKQHIVKTNIDNYYNKYLQVVSTLKGLFQVKTNYAIKVRADEYFVNYTEFLEKLKALYTHQILTSNIHFKKANDWPYHISDHIIAGKTSDLLAMFMNSLVKAQDRSLLKITPEVHLAISYLQQFGPVDVGDTQLEKIIQYTYLYFNIFPIHLFEEYKVKAGEQFVTKQDGRVQDINTLESMSDFKVNITRS